MIKVLTLKKLYARYNKKQDYISKDISFSICAGETMAIMGPSGSGKSTLLKALLGKIPLEQDKGKIYLNGHDISDSGLSCVKHKVGFVPQDDILINELTVRENIITFHTIAVDSDYDSKELNIEIDKILEKLNIIEISEKRVFEISGGQRKRVNLAMELINDPDLLIVDEPTSGLSSLDSLDLMKYFKNYASNDNKIVIFIIHQPSSDIYKLFDNLLLLNEHGKRVYSGSRKQLNELSQKDYDTYPEKIMYDIEDNKIYDSNNARKEEKKASIDRTSPFRSPTESIKDFFALIKRQFLIKFRDRTSQIITFLAPPILALLIAIVFKFTAPNQDYLFVNNALFGQFIFMMIISGIFLGLEGSSTEVIRDRGMLERESLRGLSMSSYYFSKLLTLMLFGVIQTILFVGLSLYILDATELFIPNFITMLFIIFISSALGLFISMITKTSVAAFKISTMLLIPQIILGGSFLPYSNMGDEIYLWEQRGEQKPLLANIVPASWAYEFSMSLNYEWIKENNLDMNINLEELTLNTEDSFLSLNRSESFPKYFLEVLSLDSYQAKTFIYTGFILFVFLLFFILIGLLSIRKEYLQNKWVISLSQVALIGLFTLIPLLLIKPIKSDEPKIENDLKLQKNKMNWSSAKRSCENLNLQLPTTKKLVEIYNNNKIPKSIYWTSEKYRKHQNAYWSVNFSSFKNEKNISLNKVVNSKKASVAYTPNSMKALALCVEK